MPNPAESQMKVEPVLPPATITWLWEQLTLMYGQRFLGQYDGIDKAKVMANWAYELRYVSDEQLQYGLENRPIDFPPDVGRFRAIARAMPSPERLRLPPKTGDKGVPPEVREALASLATPHPDFELPAGVAWARRYVATWGTHPHLSPFQKQTLEHARSVLALRDPELIPASTTNPEGGEEHVPT